MPDGTNTPTQSTTSGLRLPFRGCRRARSEDNFTTSSSPKRKLSGALRCWARESTTFGDLPQSVLLLNGAERMNNLSVPLEETAVPSNEGGDAVRLALCCAEEDVLRLRGSLASCASVTNHRTLILLRPHPETSSSEAWRVPRGLSQLRVGTVAIGTNFVEQMFVIECLHKKISETRVWGTVRFHAPRTRKNKALTVNSS